MTTLTAWACVIAVLCSSIVEGARGNKLHNRTVKSRYDEQRNFEGVAGRDVAVTETGIGYGV